MARKGRLSWRRLAAILFVVALVALARPEPAFFWPGLALSALGEALRLWACGYLEKNRRLAVSGPYAHLQHPLYLGTFLGLAGLLLAASGTRLPGLFLGPVAMAVFLTFFFVYYLPKKDRVEGDRLARRFGEGFRAWDREVPPFLPRLRPYRAATPQPFRWRRLAENHEHGMALVFLAGWALLYLRMRGLVF